MEHMTNIPKSVVERIIYLRNSYNTHLDVVRQMIEADNRNIFGVDLVVIGVMHRSISLIDGFTSMVEKRNVLCAGALLRLQVDSVMRLYACWLVDDPHSLIQPLLEGKPLNEARNVAEATLTAIMGRIATYTGQMVEWSDLTKNEDSQWYNLTLKPTAKDFEMGDVKAPADEVAPIPGRERRRRRS